MYQKVEFETPENIQVTYQAAGLGSRFSAWLIDQFILYFLFVCALILLVCSGIATDKFAHDWLPQAETKDPRDFELIALYFIGFFFLIIGFGSFFYYSASEYFWNGQTIGKARMKIRVVKSSGFALDSFSILIRNIFRVVDNFAILWIVPMVNSKSQRLGDLVAGTIVISEKIEDEMTLRQSLSDSPASEALFRFNASKLQTLDSRHFDAAERLVNRWNSLKPDQQAMLGGQVVLLIAGHFDMEQPSEDQLLQFLKDFLAAEYRRQHRDLG